MKTTIIHHSADFDGLFCREIAKKFLPDAEVIGWDHGDAKLPFPAEGKVYVLDLSPNCFQSTPLDTLDRLIWIDHHKSAIEDWPTNIPGYRIDGVAACRLAWQWFLKEWRDAMGMIWLLPDKLQFVERLVTEPLAVRLAGEYDVWDKRDPDAEVFQFALRSQPLADKDWAEMLGCDLPGVPGIVCYLMQNGRLLQGYQWAQDASVVNYRSFIMEFAGLKFLTLNTARCNSLTFAAKDVPETGHDALCGFYWTGQKWKVSLYHAQHRTDMDLSTIAAANGGGGHRGACGFTAEILPWL